MKQKPVWLVKIFMCLFVPIRVRWFTRFLFEKMWKAIWLEEGYANHDDITEIANRYANFRKTSIDIIMTILGIVPIGTIRLIIKRPGVPLPVEQHFDIVQLWQDNEKVVEVTLFTVRKRFRNVFGGLATLAMMRYVYRKSRNLKAKAIVIAADKRLYFFLTRFLKLPFHQIGQPKMFEGSITYPAVMFLKEAEEIVPLKNSYIAQLFKK